MLFFCCLSEYRTFRYGTVSIHSAIKLGVAVSQYLPESTRLPCQEAKGQNLLLLVNFIKSSNCWPGICCKDNIVKGNCISNTISGIQFM